MRCRNSRKRGGRTLRICPQDRAERELEAAERIGARIIFTIEPGYPALLAHVDAPPPAVYVKGDARLLQRPAVAVVGSRQASAAGITLARRFGSDLGRRGLVIVSGLARGIDAAVHEASLSTGTIAVLAGGIDYIYPPENARLQAAIAETGLPRDGDAARVRAAGERLSAPEPAGVGHGARRRRDRSGAAIRDTVDGAYGRRAGPRSVRGAGAPARSARGGHEPSSEVRGDAGDVGG